MSQQCSTAVHAAGICMETTESARGLPLDATVQRLCLRASPATSPARPRHTFFFIRTVKIGPVAPPDSRFRLDLGLIHPASPRHPRPSGARSGTPDERNARETARKIPARRVVPTCRRERAVVVLIVSSSAHRRLPRASSSARCKSCRRWTASHAAM
jgi:hypothetical protein